MNSSVFQLHPLSISYKYDIPTDAIDCSKSALDILHAIYQKAEYCLEDFKFFFFFFFFLVGADVCGYGGYIDYHLSLNRFLIPFLCFDNASDEFVFIMKTFVKDDFSFGIFFFWVN